MTYIYLFLRQKDSDDTLTDVVFDQDGLSVRSDVIGIENELEIAKKALSEAQHRQEAIEKERDQLLEELARSEAKNQEYINTILHDKEIAIAELEAAKSLFQKKLESSVEEKFTLESKLVLAKQDAVDLAVQVEKLAEVAFQQATSHILEDAQLRISSAETTAAEAALLIEKQIKDATEGTISSIVEKSRHAIERALVVAEEAGELAKRSVDTFIDDTSPFTEVADVQAENIKLQGIISDIESQLMVARSEADKLNLELENTRQQLQAFEQRAIDAEKAMLDFQESSKKNSLKKEEEMKSMLDKVKKDVAERTKAISKAFKADLKNIKATVEAAKEVVHCKDYAYLRRCEALQRSLKASEDALKTWRQRAEMAESLLLKGRLQDEGDEDSIYVVNGGRIDLLTDVDSQKWKLLSDGPRREIPQWMARRINAVSPKFPPKKLDVAEAFTSKFRSLELPTADEVWSIAREKPKEGDALVEHVYERETIEKKRKALERALQRKTVQWQRAPEQTKLGGLSTFLEIKYKNCYKKIYFVFVVHL